MTHAMLRTVGKWSLVVTAAATVTSCATAYYRTMETFGVHKRDILVDRVVEARDSQEEAGEQFRTALERFTEVVEFDGGDLEEMYERMKKEYDRSEARAKEVSGRIASVERVANDLFDEWESELDQYADRRLRQSSEETLSRTRLKYNEVIRAMRRAERKMPPVLQILSDQVLSLKHSLNARAIASLEDTAIQLESDVEELLAELERSIAEANAFIEELL